MISLIIPTRNRAALLELALNSIVTQTLSSDLFEVIVVDNGSTDSTAESVNKFAGEFTSLRYLFAPDPGLHVGRHKGMLEASGDILVFADDDIEAFPTWLESINESFSDNDVAMVGGNNIPMFLEAPPKWLEDLWENSRHDNGYKALAALSIIEFPYSKITEIDPNYIWGCNFSIRKNVLMEAGAFHPDGMPGDLILYRGDGETHVSEYVRRSGQKAIFHPGVSVYHKVTPERMTFKYFFNRGYSQGISNSYSTLREFGMEEALTNKQVLLMHFNFFVITLAGIIFFFFTSIKLRVVQKRGLLKGYLDHQRAYKLTREIQSWVHKEKYYD